MNRFTTLALSDNAKPPGLSMVGGEIYVETSRGDRGFRVETPHGVAVDLGTRFDVEVRARGTSVLVAEGAVEVATDAGTARARENEEALLARRTSPPAVRARGTRDLVRRLAWTEALGQKRAAQLSLLEEFDGPRLRPGLSAFAGGEAFLWNIRGGHLFVQARTEKLAGPWLPRAS
jgi:ferric-dicitrate binding protein FerR (iron transport regulator)